MAKDSTKMDKTDEEKIILEFKAFVQKSFLEHGLGVGSEKKVILSNKAIYVDDKFKTPLDEITLFEFLKSGNNTDLIIEYKTPTPEDLGRIKIGGIFYDSNIEMLFDELKELIPGCRYKIKRDHFNEVKNFFIYLVVLVSGIAVISRIKEPIFKLPPILLLIFLIILWFSNMIPKKFLKDDLTKRKVVLIIGYFFIFSIIVYIVLLFALYLR